MPEFEFERTRAIRRRALCMGILTALILLPTAVFADDPFQLRFSVERAGSGPVRMQGTIVNEGRSDVYDVYVTAEALDAGGKVIARGIAFVGSIPQQGSATFSASIPVVQTASTFRARVTSFRYGAGVQTS